MIVKYDNPVLRKKSKKVNGIDKRVLKTINLLKKELADSKIGIGLSAPQVAQSWYVFAIKNDNHFHEKHDHDINAYINPQIISTFGKEKTYPHILKEDGQEEDFLEGCLSFPDFYGTVKRWLKIKVKYQLIGKDNQLEDKEETLSDLMAIVFQHELDHLKGILFTDHIKRDKGRFYRLEANGDLKKTSVDSL